MARKNLNRISASERYISDHQLDAQEALVNTELIRLDLQMSPQSREEVWEFRGNLQAIRKGIQAARKELHQYEVKRKGAWDRLKIKVYEWAIRDRLK